MYMHVVCTQIHVYSSVNSLSHVMYMHVIRHRYGYVYMYTCMHAHVYVRVPVCVFLR